ncbi:MAG: class I SAM-dependent methyltransferase [Nitrospirae bacterium]|nr:class I SAM-dependent methyltransferase [Nitrospirota bacterium]
MPGVNNFEKNVQQYEEWFVDNPFAYVSELHAVQKLLPVKGSGIEIGMGTGRFSAPLGIKQGIEPSRSMAEVAKKKGLDVLSGVAENLPYKDSEFDFCLMVTTVCFLDDIDRAFQEAYRVLNPRGSFIIGFVDKNSPIGNTYQQQKNESLFYKAATFYSVDDLLVHLKKAGFLKFRFCQTLFGPLQDMQEPSEVKEGFGEGSFVVIRADKSEEDM